jgi:hypothetical protein
MRLLQRKSHRAAGSTAFSALLQLQEQQGQEQQGQEQQGQEQQGQEQQGQEQAESLAASAQ